MTAAMTDSERALWVQAKADYTHALAIAQEAWGTDPSPTDEAIQAATATILIHVTKLRGETRLHVKVPQSTAPAAVTSEVRNSQAPGAVPPCKKCGGPMDDVRGEKRNEKSPDFVCRQEKGDCGKPNKDKTKWFATAQWIEKPTHAGANSQPNAMSGKNADVASYEKVPAAIEDDDGDSGLPF